MQRKFKNCRTWENVEAAKNRFNNGAENSLKQDKSKRHNKDRKPKKQTPYYKASYFYEIVKEELGEKWLDKNLSLADIGKDKSFATKVLLSTREKFPNFGISPMELWNLPLQKVFQKVRGSMRNNVK